MSPDHAPLFVGRISHVVGLVRPENLESVMDQMGRALGIEFEGPFLREDTKLRAAVAAEAGIELITPATADHPMHEDLERNGERWTVVGFGVSDADETRERVRRLGYESLGSVVRTGSPGWAGHYNSLEAIRYDRSLFGGLPMAFARFD